MCPVGDAEIDRTLEIMRKQRATYEDVTRPAAVGDVVTVDFKGTQDGTPFDGGSASDFPFALGQGRMLPEFEAAIPGMTPGETRTFPLTFPADYTAKELAGKTVQFEVDPEEGAAARAAARSTRSSRSRSASPTATSGRCARRSAPTSSARSLRACARGPRTA